MKKYLYILIGLGLWFHFYHIEETTPIGAGITSPSEPFQGDTSLQALDIDRFEIKPRASFDADIRVLDAANYYFDRKAWLSPTVIVAGWGSLSDESIFQKVNFDIVDRSYAWVNESLEVDDEEIRRQTAAINLIPADNTIADIIKQIRIGQVLKLQGTLVDIERTMHWKWKTSLSRTDRGSGAAKILYVTEIEIIEPSFLGN